MATENSHDYAKHWQFIEEFLPNYYRRDDVLLSDILLRYLNDEAICESDITFVNKNYGNKENVLRELKRLETQFFAEAFDTFCENIFKFSIPAN